MINVKKTNQVHVENTVDTSIEEVNEGTERYWISLWLFYPSSHMQGNERNDISNEFNERQSKFSYLHAGMYFLVHYTY